MRVVIIGAGVSGIVTARVLDAMGIEVSVYEQRPDLGGVWSATRAYPHISTQDDRESYAFSDFPFPESVSEHPTGAEVRAYLEDYVEAHGLGDRIHLSTRVESAEPLRDGAGWTVRISGQGWTDEVHADWLVAANGVFSTPHVPRWPGRAAFEGAGGTVVVPSEVGDGRMFDAARVVVVGWGKTACDIAVGARDRALRTDVVARTLTWKYPKRIGGTGLTFRHLVLTRAGERLIGGAYRGPDGRILLGRLPERLPRKLLGRLIGRVIDRQSGLTELGLRPVVDVSASTSLVTDGFFEGVRQGRIRVHREQTVVELAADDGRPAVVLANGDHVPADVLVAATGYDQSLDFLPDAVLAPALATTGGRLRLHRRILAVDVPRLAFVGWAHSYRSPLTSELSAIWLGALIAGKLHAPDSEAARRAAALFPVTRGGAASERTTHLPGVSLRDLDELLADLSLPLTRAQRARQRFRAVEPVVYAAVLPALLATASVVQEVVAP